MTDTYGMSYNLVSVSYAPYGQDKLTGEPMIDGGYEDVNAPKKEVNKNAQIEL